jgi:VWFA-related protein
VKAAQVTVYVVAIGGVAGISIKGERLLKRLASETGGRCFLPEREEQLLSVHDTLTGDVQNRYLLSYTPANQLADGKWRRITVSTVDPDLLVRARAGYFAPKPAPIRGSLEFTAVDASGHYLDLAAEDLEVLEDGEPQKIDTFQEALQPVSIVLALDASGSMRKSEAEVAESAREFVSALRPEDALALVMFSDRSVFVHDLSTKREDTIKGIDSYKSSGGTALYDALSDAFTRLTQVDTRRAIVAMTDGRDENNPGNGPGSVSRYEDVVELLKQRTATVFAIGLGAKVDQPLLREMAELSGGLALFPRDVKELAGEYRRIVEDLRRRYIVAFTSSHPQHDGRWRTVTVRVKNLPEATVRSVGGYFAPEK